MLYTPYLPNKYRGAQSESLKLHDIPNHKISELFLLCYKLQLKKQLAYIHEQRVVWAFDMFMFLFFVVCM